jgi:hypothetical protein
MDTLYHYTSEVIVINLFQLGPKASIFPTSFNRTLLSTNIHIPSFYSDSGLAIAIIQQLSSFIQEDIQQIKEKEEVNDYWAETIQKFFKKIEADLIDHFTPTQPTYNLYNHSQIEKRFQKAKTKVLRQFKSTLSSAYKVETIMALLFKEMHAPEAALLEWRLLKEKYLKTGAQYEGEIEPNIHLFFSYYSCSPWIIENGTTINDLKTYLRSHPRLRPLIKKQIADWKFPLPLRSIMSIAGFIVFSLLLIPISVTLALWMHPVLPIVIALVWLMVSLFLISNISKENMKAQCLEKMSEAIDSRENIQSHFSETSNPIEIDINHRRVDSESNISIAGSNSTLFHSLETMNEPLMDAPPEHGLRQSALNAWHHVEKWVSKAHLPEWLTSLSPKK